jgi:hypothetical protein
MDAQDGAMTMEAVAKLCHNGHGHGGDMNADNEALVLKDPVELVLETPDDPDFQVSYGATDVLKDEADYRAGRIKAGRGKGKDGCHTRLTCFQRLKNITCSGKGTSQALPQK